MTSNNPLVGLRGRPAPAGLMRLVRWVRGLALLGVATQLGVPPAFWLNPAWVAAAGPAAAGLAGGPITIDDRARWLGEAARLADENDSFI